MESCRTTTHGKRAIDAEGRHDNTPYNPREVLLKRRRGRNRRYYLSVCDRYVVFVLINFITCGRNITGFIHSIFGFMKVVTGDGQTVIFAVGDVKN